MDQRRIYENTKLLSDCQITDFFITAPSKAVISITRKSAFDYIYILFILIIDLHANPSQY